MQLEGQISSARAELKASEKKVQSLQKELVVEKAMGWVPGVHEVFQGR